LTKTQAPRGFFKVIGSTGSIQNLKLRGTVSPSRRENHTGGIAGINYGTITASSFSGTLSGARNTGGIAGVNMGTISQCTAGGTYAGKKDTGGIAGYNLGNITNCENNAYVNTAAAETAISLEDVDLNLTGDLDTFVNDNSSIIVMDTGGIAGYSCGYIATANHGNIGYQSVDTTPAVLPEETAAISLTAQTTEPSTAERRGRYCRPGGAVY